MKRLFGQNIIEACKHKQELFLSSPDSTEACEGVFFNLQPDAPHERCEITAVSILTPVKFFLCLLGAFVNSVLIGLDDTEVGSSL